MELQFPKTTLACMKRLAWETKNEEQTLEYKLTDAMPDIGKVLGAWGQPLIRSKEWRGSGMGVSGGVMAWVLYAPEDGSAPQSVEAWIPFQLRWDFPQAQRDGTMRICCLLRNVDARTVSARKLMLRCVLSVNGEALEPGQVEICQCGPVPQDIQVLRKSYPVRMAREAGEKSFLLDEEMLLPPDCAHAQKLLHYNILPALLDKKIMADKIVFRGMALLQGLCADDAGEMKPFALELPFSQYAELEQEYDPYAVPDICLAATNLEAELQENGILRVKAGLVGQYVVYDRPVLEVVEDAYSLNRTVELQMERLRIPAVLDSWQETVKAEGTAETDGEPVDTAFYAAQPVQSRTAQGMALEIPGTFHLLARDSQGTLQGNSVQWQGSLEVPVPGEASLLTTGQISGRVQTSSADGTELRGEMSVDMLAVMDTDIPMVTGIELGAPREPDPERPSIILRKAGEESLWEIAKSCGTTVDAIRQANAVADEPGNDRFLLIPVP